jgi:hypothetical protein
MLDRFLILLLTGVALALGACGDDDDDGGGDGGTTKAEFIEKADAICAAGEERSEQIARDGLQNPQNPTGEEILAILEELVPLQRDVIDDVRALETPEGDEDEINDFLDKAEQATDETEQIDDPSQALAMVQAADTPADPFHEANQAAADYGLKDCAE